MAKYDAYPLRAHPAFVALVPLIAVAGATYSWHAARAYETFDFTRAAGLVAAPEPVGVWFSTHVWIAAVVACVWLWWRYSRAQEMVVTDNEVFVPESAFGSGAVSVRYDDIVRLTVDDQALFLQTHTDHCSLLSSRFPSRDAFTRAVASLRESVAAVPAATKS